jgi:Flp pilus assembly protein TadB
VFYAPITKNGQTNAGQEMIFEIVISGLILMLIYWLFKSGLIWWILILIAALGFILFL